MRAIRMSADGKNPEVLDQRWLPHRTVFVELESVAEAAEAIRSMWVRGAPLIGVTAAYGMALAMRVNPHDHGLENADAMLRSTRPTAVNLMWALDRVKAALLPQPPEAREAAAWALAHTIRDEDAAMCKAIGEHGADIFADLLDKKRARGADSPLHVLTHCNTGWLATADYGTALSAIYVAHERGLPVHVWVDETRPRNQGASLTMWELQERGVPCTLIADNAGGHLMQHGQVDVCIVGADRVTRTGDAANKIGTYLKALAAQDNGVPFYVAMPSSTVDWDVRDGARDIDIENRAAREVTHMRGKTADGDVVDVQITADDADALNPAFDVTPARLLTGLITERGVCDASEKGLTGQFPER